MEFSLDQFPNELLLQIINNLPLRDQCQSRRICSRWSALANLALSSTDNLSLSASAFCGHHHGDKVSDLSSWFEKEVLLGGKIDKLRNCLQEFGPQLDSLSIQVSNSSMVNAIFSNASPRCLSIEVDGDSELSRHLLSAIFKNGEQVKHLNITRKPTQTDSIQPDDVFAPNFLAKCSKLEVLDIYALPIASLYLPLVPPTVQELRLRLQGQGHGTHGQGQADFIAFLTKRAGNENLRELTLSGYIVEPKCLPILGAKCPNLRKLHIDLTTNDNVNELADNIKHAPRCLTDLCLRIYSKSNLAMDTFLKNLLATFPNLTSLQLESMCPENLQLSDISLKVMPKLATRLTKLQLRHFHLAKASDESLEALTKCSLTSLLVNSWSPNSQPGFTDTGVINLLTNCPTLKELTMTNYESEQVATAK